MLTLLLLLPACTPPASEDTADAPAEDTAPAKDSGDSTDSDDTGDGIADIDPAELPAGPNPCRAPELVWVNYVVDGDTANVASSEGDESVRFIGVDTPEVDWDGDDDDCYGPEASDFTEQALEGRYIWLTFDSYCFDDYNRLLAYVHTGLGEQGFHQRQLLQGGYAETMHYSGTDSFRETFDEDEALAQQAGRGLWSACR